MSHTKTPPLLSIVIPTYNRCFYLDQLLFSIVTYARVEGIQTDLFEVVVSDNASTDDTPLVCQRYSNLIARFRTIRHPHLISGESNIISCWPVATGEWVWTWGDDDILNAGTLTKIINMLHRTDIDIIILNYSHVWQNGTTMCTEKVVNIDAITYPINFEQMITKPRFFDPISFISVCIFRRQPLTSILPDQLANDLHIYSHLAFKIEAFARKPSIFVAETLVTQRLGLFRVGKEEFTVPKGIAFFKSFVSLIKRDCVDANMLWSMTMSKGICNDTILSVHEVFLNLFFTHTLTPGTTDFELVRHFVVTESAYLPRSVLLKMISALNPDYFSQPLQMINTR